MFEEYNGVNINIFHVIPTDIMFTQNYVYDLIEAFELKFSIHKNG